MAVAVWSYPNQQSFKAVNGQLQLIDHYNEALLSDKYLIAPYNHGNGIYAVSTKNAKIIDKAADYLKHVQLDVKSLNEQHIQVKYEDQVGLAISEIKNSDHFEKVVFSRYTDEPINGFNLFWLDQLRCAYPNAFISLVSDQQLGTWITASPELYLKGDEQVFSSFSLAGTKHDGHQHLGAKEKEEQSIVTDFISEAFEASGLQIDISKGIEHKAGNLTHLLNVVNGTPNSKNFDFEMLFFGLHPTPAVCGYPRKWAKQFIGFENYDRELYTGFMGEYNSIEQFELYVNLRCAQVFNNKLRLYAGAGITANSVPERELLETEAKMQVLRNVLLAQQ